MTDHDLAKLTDARGRAEAAAIIAALDDADIEVIVDDVERGFGLADMPSGTIAIQVHAGDLDRAREVLAEHGEVDWDEVDVGDRVDAVPLSRGGRTPPAARIAGVIAIAVAVIAVVAGTLVLIL